MDDRVSDALLDALPEAPVEEKSRHLQDGVLASSALWFPADRLVRLLCGHEPVPVSKHETSQLLFPDFNLETVRLVLPRGGYSTVEEREAEVLASLMLERVAASSPLRTSPRKTASDEVLHRLAASLQADRGES